MATILSKFVREETLRSIENKATDLQGSAVDYVNIYFGSINPVTVQSKLMECFTQKQIGEVVASVPDWAKDIESRIEKKLLDPKNKYSEDELAELYPMWMIGYAITAFDSENQRNTKISKEIKREARASAQSIEQLKAVNKAVLDEKLSKLPVYN